MLAEKMMENSNLNDLLMQGLRQMDIYLPHGAAQQLLAYLTLLHKWNQAYNLTAVNEPEEMVVRHLLDCLAVLPYLPKTSPILDVGSGAGLPGLVLAIARPTQQFFLLDSQRKRTIFLEKVVRALDLKQINIINSRVEKYHPEMKFAIITSRAYSSLKLFLETTHHLADENTLYFALKGKLQAEEINEIKNNVLNFNTYPLSIPTLNAARHLITFNKK